MAPILGLRGQVNRITFSNMKILNKKQSFSKTNNFKRLIIVFGACLGLFTISSFDSWNLTNETSKVQGVEACTSEKASVKILELNIDAEPKTIMHHNFIASFLLQESSFERKNKKSKEQNNFFSHLKQLHKMLITQALGSF